MYEKIKLDWLILPMLGIAIVIGLWAISSATWAKELPSPVKTWEASKDYVLKPFEKRGEMDQGILRFTWYSLVLVAKGYALALHHRHADWIFPRPLENVHQDLRSDHSGLAPGLAAGLVAARPRAVPERGQAGFGTGRAVHHRHLRDVADGPEHRGRRARDSAGLFERRESAEAFAHEDALQSAHSRQRCRTCSPAFV